MQITKDYQELLTDIFSKYDEKNLKTIPSIMKQFRQNKEQVIMHLCDRYNIDINSLDGVDMSGGPAVIAAPAADGESGESESATVEGEEGAEDEEAPKKKSKLIMIIIIVVVVAGLGGGGFYAFQNGMIPGMGGSDTEEHAPEEGATEEGEHDAAPEPEAGPETEPEPEVADTTATTDSTATDSTAAGAEPAEGEAGEGEGGH